MGKFAKRHGGKVVGSDSSDRPGWKGPGYIKKADPKPKKMQKAVVEVEDEEEVPQHVLPVELQQLLLGIFKDAFPELIVSDELKPTLQEVKQALYARDFARAFGKDEFLEAYAIRWSPSRALCYASILVELRQHLQAISVSGTSGSDGNESNVSILHAVAFGGGAAEVVAFGGLHRYLRDASAREDVDEATAETSDDVAAELDALSLATKTENKTELVLMDTAKWGDVVARLDKGLSSLPSISKYASASAKAAVRSLLPASDLAATFDCEDVLALSPERLEEVIGKRPMLLTLLFTLNELYTASIAKTTSFLLSMANAVKPGTLLLVVDSPGSYSETTVGKEAKKYPMHFLLDHTLIGPGKTKDGVAIKPTWEKIVSEDSRWFRLPKDARYPIDLEDMRYQLHLYRRL
ncbi:hypothetical protein PVAG01_06642 [Phlyctema vagabunda]|uniref:25S rRNA (Uridine(2843)-N(3))-methyltransferase n=1 Tax=Phlyctema vagabunda TaxID=108571 RepID=A0ABR4PGM3_9HELO